MNARTKYDAAQKLLTAPTFTGRVDAMVRPPANGADHGVILWDDVREIGRTCSTGEKILIEFAWQLWSGEYSALLEDAKGPTLADAIRNLDAEHVMLISNALVIAALGLAE